jgi:hypothetical protein
MVFEDQPSDRRPVEQDLTIPSPNNSFSFQPESGSGRQGSHFPLALASLNIHWLDPITELKRVFSFPAMLGGLLVAGVFWAKRGFNVDTDFWWHLKVGEDILATHHWPTTDAYSFTAPGQPWIAAEWLGDVLFAWIERIGGLRGLDVLLIVMSAAIILALYAFCTLRSDNSKASFAATAVLTVLSLPVFNFRPQMLGFLFLVLTLIALERFRQGRPGSLWFLPVLFVIWVNAHGSWMIGLFTIFVYWASGLQEFQLGGMEMRAWTVAQREQLLFVFLLCIAVLPLTPYGTRLAFFPFQFINSLPVNLASINEWQPMPFNLVGAKLFLALILGLFVAQLVYKSKWRCEDLTLFFFGTAMACLHVRFLLIFVPFFAPLFAMFLARFIPGYERQKDQYWINAALMGAMLAGMIYYFPAKAEIEKNIATMYPSGAVSYMRTHSFPSPMFNSYGFGGYLEWSSGGHDKVFVDGRGELYEPGGVLADYMHISLLKPGALSVLRGYQVQACLLDSGQPLAVLLAALPEWKAVYADNVSVLLIRRNSGDGAGMTEGRNK